MLRILVDTLVPVYALVAVGLILARTVGAEARAPATLSYWVLGPAFIFDVLAGAELEAGEVVRLVGAAAAGMVVVGVAAHLTARLAGVDRSARSASVLTSVHGNVGNFGLAISAFALGTPVLPIAGIVMVTVNTLGFVIGVGLATARTGSWWSAARAALTTPLTVAVLPALLVNTSNTTLPIWLDRPVSLLAGALIPVMLLTLGIQLSSMERALPRRLAALPIGLKLVASPLVAAGLATLVGLAGDAAAVLIIQAAMPAAVFTSLIALEHDLEPDYVTSVVLAGTLLSAVTLPVVLALI